MASIDCTYSDGLRLAYFEELAAERVYRELARRSTEPLQQKKFDAIADVERFTARTLEPAARRLGIAVAESQLEARVRQRLAELGCLSWSEFIAQAGVKWPPYIEQFQQLAALAPKEDADVMRLLVAHERALVHFVEIENDWPTTLKSIEPLTALLALLGPGFVARG